MSSHFTPPPQNPEAEEYLLGALMANPVNIAEALAVVQRDDFYDEGHRLIFEAITGLDAAGNPVEPLTVVDWLTKRGDLDTVGGQIRVLDLMSGAFLGASYRTYAALVHETATLRRLQRVGQEIETMVVQRGGETDDLLVRAEDLVYGLMQRQVRGGLLPSTDLVNRTLESLTEAYERGSEVSGLPTGFADLDKITGGFQAGNLVIVAARPSMGKTALALAMAQNAALRGKRTVAIFSLEMSGDDLIQRMIASEGRIDASRLRSGRLSAGDWPLVTKAADQVSRAKIFIDESPGISVGEMRTKSRRLKAREGLHLVVVDYIQLMDSDWRRGREENRVLEISAMSRGLKLLARDLEVPVICLSQLNRSPESRPDKRPLLSDLRESGAIEQDADLVLLIYRDDYYNDDSTERGVAEVNVAKNRNGPTGKARLNFEGTYAAFSNLTRERVD
ncbi:MAG: replicative DNA helicase [Actinobacteria bacterium]|nr:replicative DNA helicase [Actinomycetota bacterium]